MAAVNVVAHSGIFGILLACTIKILLEFEKKQNVPYMDEIFHVPQAQNYCHGNYHYWDNKITTLPGLYFSSQVYMRVLSFILGQPVKDLCSCFNLRITNVFFLVGIFSIIRNILRCQVEKWTAKEELRIMEWSLHLKVDATAFVLAIFPLLYFFVFLYYTDVGSTFFVLLSYYLSIRHSYGMSSMAGGIAILFRQTNIVWVGFICVSAILRLLEERDVYRNCDTLVNQIWRSIVESLYHFKYVFVIGFPYFLVFLSFVVFLIKNNGIVVGDRSSHEVSLNLPQMLYFFIFTVFFANFTLLKFINPWYTFEKVCSSLKSPLMVLTGFIIIAGSFLAVRYFTYIHLYLISDNRHYTFYIWKRIFEAHWAARYAAIPFYFASLLVVLNELIERNRSIWIVIFLGCTAVVLVPQKLLEFRYFILPYLLFRLNMKLSNWAELMLEFVTYAAINGGTMYLFLNHTFTQNNLEGQRFMW